ncbi:MAG TPA: alcohol dehydrogenase catalytic domain-containing protein, partial [Anaerolineales bacterium]|nr:alcohol dehydrogenase catalytic domain-containing protein [Anaerolineales bacterium]
MKAIRLHDFGDAGQLTYEDVPEPVPGPGEVRGKVEAAGLNFIDIYHRRGLYPNSLPFILGSEFCGIVDAVGEGVTDFQVGDRMATASARGAYAEYAVAPA